MLFPSLLVSFIILCPVDPSIHSLGIFCPPVSFGGWAKTGRARQMKINDGNTGLVI
jgi:hypothetical protein